MPSLIKFILLILLSSHVILNLRTIKGQTQNPNKSMQAHTRHGHDEQSRHINQNYQLSFLCTSETKALSFVARLIHKAPHTPVAHGATTSNQAMAMTAITAALRATSIYANPCPTCRQSRTRHYGYPNGTLIFFVLLQFVLLELVSVIIPERTTG